MELAWLSVRADRSALPVAISCAAVFTSELAALTSWMMPRSDSVKSLNARAIWPTSSSRLTAMRDVRSPPPPATATMASRTLRNGANALRSRLAKIRPVTTTTASAATAMAPTSVPRPAIAADLS
jgi:hypothetical protein